MLTTEDWLIIEDKIRAIVGKQSATDFKSSKTKTKNYHTVPEIRQAIIDNVDTLRSYLGDEEFHINVLRHALKKTLDLKEGDLESVRSGNGVATRIDDQIKNAISHWPSRCQVPPVIVKGTKKEWYKFNDASWLVGLPIGQSLLNLNK